MSIIIKSGSSGNLANVDAQGNLYVSSVPAAVAYSATPWTSATNVNATQMLLDSGGYATASVQLNQTSTITGGQVVFEGTYDNINWITVPGQFVLDPISYNPISAVYNLEANVNKTILVATGGFRKLRLRLNEAIVGTGNVTIFWTLLSTSPLADINVATVIQGNAADLMATVIFPSPQPVTVENAVAVSGTVDVSNTVTVTQPSSQNFNATVVQPVASAFNATVVFPSAQPITVTNWPGYALNSTFMNGSAKVQLYDGTNVIGTSAHPVSVQIGSSGSGTVNVNPQMQVISGFVPDPSGEVPTGETASPLIDGDGNLVTRSLILVDEGSYRCHFSGAGALNVPLTGTLNFTNGSATVTGVGTQFSTELQIGYFIKKVTDSETLYLAVDSIQSDTSLTLYSPYQGTTATGADGIYTQWATVTSSGSTIETMDSDLHIISGVSPDSIVGVFGGRPDYLPIVVEFALSVSQAEANQIVVFGVQDTFGTPEAQVTVQFSGTNPTVGRFVTAFSSDEHEVDSLPFAFPNDGNFLDSHKYRIGISGNRTELSIDDTVVATNTSHIPGPYVDLTPVLYIKNTGTPSSPTHLVCDYVYFSDVDRIQIDNQFDESIPFSLSGPYRTNNIPATVTPFNSLRVSQEATQIFADSFEDTINSARWNTFSANGGTPPAAGEDQLDLIPGTTVNGYSYIQSKPEFPLVIPGYLQNHWSIVLDDPTSTDNYRFWGFGTTIATPTLTTPILDGIGFEIGINGKLYAVTYSSSDDVTTVRNEIADLSASGSDKQPHGTNSHIFYVWFAGFSAYWAIDDPTNIVASISNDTLSPNDDDLPLTAISISNGTSGGFTINSVSVGDTSRNNMTISDGTNPWRKATIKCVAPVSADTAIVVSLHPSGPLPAGTNLLGVVNINTGQSIQVTQGTSPWVVSGTINSKAQDGSGNAITSTGNALDVNIKSGLSGGTQYATGVVNASPTGTVIMGRNPSNNLLPLSLDSNGYLNVDVVGGITVTGGSFTAASDGPTGQDVPADAGYIGYRDSNGKLTGVSASTPLPVQGSISVSNPTVGATGATAPTSATEIGFIDGGGNLVAPSATTPLPVTGTVNVDVENFPLPVTQSGVWEVRVTGEAGTVFDEPVGSSSQASNLLQVGGWATTSNPAYGTATQQPLSLTTSGSVRTDLTTVAGTALTAVPANFGSTITGSVQGVNASIFAGSTSVPSGTFGTSPTAVSGALPVNASLYIGTTGITTTGVAGQPLVGIAGRTGVALDAVLGATKPANVLQVGGNDGTNAYALPLSSGGSSLIVSLSGGSVTVGNFPATQAVTQSGTWNVGITGTPTVTANAGTGTFTVGGTVSVNALPTGSNTIGNVEITDGTNIGNVIAGDSGQNAQVVTSARKEVSYTTTSVQAVASTDVSNYRYVSVQITSQGGSSSVAFQCSNDNSNWFNCPLIQSSTTGQSSAITAASGTGIFSGGLVGRYFRLNVTGIVSGTTAGVVEFSSLPPAATITSSYVSLGTGANTIGTVKIVGNGGAVVDGVITAATAPANMIAVGGVFNSTLPTLTTGQSAAIQVDAKGQQLIDLNYVAGNAVVTAATGIQKVGIAGATGATFDAAVGAATAPTNMVAVGGVYNSTLPTLTTGQSAAVQVDAKGQQLVDLNYVAGGAVATAAAGIIKVGLTDGTGAALTSSSNALDVNLKTSALTDPAEVATGTTAPTKVVMVGGKTNDGTAQYQMVPLGAAGRSVIIEGYAGGTAVPVSGSGTFSTNLAQVNGSTVSTAATGIQKVGLTDSSGNAITQGQKTMANSLPVTIASDNIAYDGYKNQGVYFGGAAADAFGRARVSSPQTLFNTSFEYDLQPLIMQQVVSGTGTITKTTNVSSATLSTGGTASGAGADFQSKAYFRYEPGKSLLILMTGTIGAAVANVRSQFGFWDANNGVFFDQNNGIGVTVRTNTSGSPVDTTVNQANWNIDKMNGTGTSGITLDFTKTQIFVVDLQWLGTGRIRFGFEVNGILYYCHQVLNANALALPYMNTAVLPVHWAIHNTGTAAGTNTVTAICCAVVSEGGSDHQPVYQFAASSPIGSLTTATSTRTPILSIRPKTTFNSVANRSRIKLETLSVFNNGGATGYWELIYNGTLTAASFADVSASYSAVQADSSASAITNGVVVASGYVQGGSHAESVVDLSSLKIPLTLDAAGSVQDIFSVCVTSSGGGIATAAALSWSEER